MRTASAMRWRGFLIAFICFLLLSADALIEAQENRPVDVTVAYSNPGISTLPVNIAQEKGFFAAEKLTVNLVLMQTFVAGRAVMGGNVDYNSLAGNMITLAAGGAPVKVVFVLIEKPLFAFVSRPELKSARDLKNKKVAVSTRGSIDDYFVREIVAASGLNPEKDITSLSMGGTSNRLTALRTGAVDATGISVPYNLPLEREGYHRIAVAADTMHAVTNGLGVSEQKLKSQPDQIKRMIRAMLKSLEYIKSHRAESVQRAMVLYKFDAATAELAYDMLLKSLPARGIPSEKAFETVINLSREQLGLRGEVPLSKVANLDLLKEVVGESNR